MRVRFAMTILLSCLVLALSISLPTAMAGKPDGKGGGKGGGGDDGSDPPTSVPFHYEITWLGRPAGSYLSSALDINNSGAVVGFSRENSLRTGFLWTADTGMQSLDDLAEVPLQNYSLLGGRSVNESNIIVGQVENLSTGTVELYRYLPTSEGYSLEVLPNSTTYDVTLNESGDAAYLSPLGDEVISYSTTGLLTTIATPGATSIVSINDLGQVLVNYDGGCYRVTFGADPAIDDFPGFLAGYGAMNQLGQFGAQATSKKYRDTAVRLITPGQLTALADVRSVANAINENGDVSGHAMKTRWTPYVYTDEHGYLDVDLLMTGDTSKYQSASHLRIYGMNDNLDLCGRAGFQTETGEWVYEAFVLTRVE